MLFAVRKMCFCRDEINPHRNPKYLTKQTKYLTNMEGNIAEWFDFWIKLTETDVIATKHSRIVNFTNLWIFIATSIAIVFACKFARARSRFNG